MKTLKSTLVINKTKKTINGFLEKLDINAMINIKGGDEDPDDVWPPAAPVIIDPILPDPSN